MISDKKLTTNRQNARKSTGPKSPRGKAASRFNALRFGIFATSRLLPGEDEAAYKKLSREFLRECRPNGPIQKMLADQLLGAYWRLLRLERAEQRYFIEIRTSQLRRFLSSLDDDALASLKEANRERAHHRRPRPSDKSKAISSGLDQTASPFDRAASDRIGPNMEGINGKLEAIFSWDGAMLEAIVPSSERRPKSYLDQERRAIMRDLMRALAALKELQRNHRPEVYLRAAPDV